MNSINDSDQSQPEEDREATGMLGTFQKDVASWKLARSEEAAARTEAFATQAPPPAAAKPVRRAKPVAAPLPVPAAQDVVKKKPFSMSYHGVTSDQHIARMIALRYGGGQ